MSKNYYKYLPTSRISYLENELLRFTQASDLNDPFECLPQKPSIEKLNALIDSLIPTNTNKMKGKIVREKFDSNFLSNLYETQYGKVNQDIGILSLSKNWKNSLMWAHYTESHKGFCIGFDSQHNFFTNYLCPDKETSKTIREVIYSEKRVEIPMILGQEKLNFEPYITKSLDWKYEEEVRIISTLNSREHLINGKPLDIYLFKVPHSAINEIVLGANINVENEEKIRKFASDKKIKLWKSKIAETTFDMERE
ncbi:DUF2971 domain-containing protein [Flavobacterium cupreum]|uniref:DUF2971 domain-containing protein n=2 Tax=Flavobacterium TaxID=237 RepID=A0A4Y7UG72_9FLAO|nr:MULTISPECIES: DUF2971 domain-containing protein [Flavobacterium]RUT71543.1 DUF2971 domain-containing protein [Flavobacterium cupreum]TCN59620.1 DUF2971 family protein [Flavobacterium circumlabens]TEB44898.1 DUF2971 domain-containing protein [Flavobacterium circumlabens]